MRGRMLVGTVALGAIAVAQVGVARAAAPPEHGYVTDALNLPATSAEAASFGRDLDGDGNRDNQLGEVIAAFAGQGLDLRAAQNDAITSGRIVMLHSLRASSLAGTNHATWQVLYAEPTPDPDLTGSGTFEVASALPRSPRLAATIKDHVVKTAPGRIPVQLDIGVAHELDPLMVLQMKKAVVRATCNRRGCSEGRIAGAVSEEQIDALLIPELAALFQTVLEQDCPGPDPSSCAPDSSGQTVQGLFDTDDDMQITADELRENALIQSVLAPDLDLIKADGSPGHDGVMDALSFGFGFTTVPATLTRP